MIANTTGKLFQRKSYFHPVVQLMLFSAILILMMDSRIAEENALCFDFLILNVFDDGCDYHCDYDFDHNDQQNYYFKLKLFKLTFKVDYEKLIITITLTEFYLHFFDGAERVTLFDILTNALNEDSDNK
ncbi:hypothetical protein T4C_4675 [Trichinella pseudospiralis]|uniref:Transmembrane protein n=1 Tax=Trichinella pseudospiralis TaxID=6337 RepID=A0A0V1JZY2_TRIPS|nr:hypothetical protein T4C_4675 [Trichinella pseudospiralis]